MITTSLLPALLLSLAAAPATPAPRVDTNFVPERGSHPFNVRDLVLMDRVSDAQLSPDGNYAAFSLRSTDYKANKGVTAIYVQDLRKKSAPVKVVVFQWPCGTPARQRSPRGARPRSRAILVDSPVSSMKTSFAGSRSSWLSNQARRLFRMSGRSCSSACADFF